MPTLRRLTAALSALLVLQLTLPGLSELCEHGGASDMASSGMSASHHARGTVSPAAAPTVHAAHPGETPCHAPDAMAACATMVTCASLSALPSVQARPGHRPATLAVVVSTSAAPRPVGSAPDTPPPKA